MSCKLSCCERMRQLGLGTESDPLQSDKRKKMETSLPQLQGNDLCQQLNELKKQTLDDITVPAHTVMYV